MRLSHKQHRVLERIYLDGRISTCWVDGRTVRSLVRRKLCKYDFPPGKITVALVAGERFGEYRRLTDVGLLEYRQGEIPAFVVTEKAKEIYGQAERT